MFLSELQIKGFRLFKEPTTVKLHRGLNLLVGENGCGKSSIIDAIRMLLNESEFFHRGLREEDFYQEYGVDALPTMPIFVSGIFSDLDADQRVEYLTWLTPQFGAKLNVEYQYNADTRRLFKPKRWGGNSCDSIFDWEPLDDIQCVYLPALRDAERSLRSGRGSRLSRFITNLSVDELVQRRKNHEKMPLEDKFYQFNQYAAEQEDIKKANELINSSLKSAAGAIFGQSTRIQFNELSYERIVESLQLLFSQDIGCAEIERFRNLSENSLGYNNLIYIATILAEFEGLKDKYTTPRILLVEELEAHLHPQLQIKLLKYLSEQSLDYDIQVIITTHSTILAAVVPIDQIISVHNNKDGISIVPIRDCGIESAAKAFLNRWLDATKSALFFSKGNIFVEGIAEAILIPKLAEVYLKQYTTTHSIDISSLEDVGISIVNMNGIYFQYFIQLYNGYSVCIPVRQKEESKKEYENRIKEFNEKPRFSNNEVIKTLTIAYILGNAVSDVYLNACPGSGKTEVVGVKTAYEINRWNARYAGIAILTFTNSAENELLFRVSSYLGHQVKYPHFLGTFSSWLHGYIANPFLELETGYHDKLNLDNSIRVIDTDCTNNFLCSFQTQYTYKELGNIKANEFHITEKVETPVIYDGMYRNRQVILNGCLQTGTWRSHELVELKKKFWKSGFATYEDIEYLSYKMLRNNPDIAACLAKRFPLVIVDECQDLSLSQLQILYALHTHGTKLHFVGDLDQSIYKFRNIDPIETKGFIEQLAMKELPLAENYRSCQAIVNASSATLCKPQKFIVGKIEQKVGVPLVALLYQQGQEQQVLKIFETLVNESQLSLENSRVIVRNNNLREKLLGRKFSSLLAINTIEEYARFLYLNSADSSVNSFQAAIRILARALQRTFFSESVHSSFNQLSKPDEFDGRQWRTIINGVWKQLLSQEVLFNFGITWSQWKVNLKPVLENLTTGIPLLYDRPVNLGRIRPGESKRVALEAFENTRNDSIPCDIETIHSCKGMSLDAVLFMSTYKQSHEQESGSHWYDWFASASNAINEGNRLAYVAFSRARHLLVLGIPNPPSSKLNSSQLQLLVQAGFRIETINERI